MWILVERVGESEGQSQSQLAVSENVPLGVVAFSVVRLSNPSREAEEMLSES